MQSHVNQEMFLVRKFLSASFAAKVLRHAVASGQVAAEICRSRKSSVADLTTELKLVVMCNAVVLGQAVVVLETCTAFCADKCSANNVPLL